MNMHTLNIWAIVAATISAFVIGGLWYSPVLLGSAWKRANGFTADPPAAGPKGFTIAFLLSLVMAFNLAMFLNAPTTTLAFGATAGFLAGAGWVTDRNRDCRGLRAPVVEVRSHQRRLSYRGPDGDGRNSGRMAVSRAKLVDRGIPGLEGETWGTHVPA